MTKGRILLGVGVGAAALLLFGGLFTWISLGNSYGPDRQLDLAMKLLDEGRWDLADRIARDLEEAKELTPKREPVWSYVRGVAGALSTVGHLDSPTYRKVLWDSAAHLEKSRDSGYPLGYRIRGAFYLGWCYFHTYDWDKALETLADVAGGWPERRSDALEMMVDACLRSEPPKRDRAAHLLDEWTKIPGLNASEKNRITLGRAHLAFVDGQWEQCDALLSSIPRNSNERHAAMLGAGRWKLAASKRLAKDDPLRRQRLEEALVDFRQALLASGTPDDVRRQAALMTGETLRALGRTREAISTLSAVRQRNPESAEAIAAGVAEAEIQLEIGDLHDALETIRHIVSDIGDTRLYDQRWMPLPELRRRMLELGRDIRGHGDFETSIRLAAYLPPVFPLSDSVRMEAETFEAWGRKLESQPQPVAGRARDVQCRQIDAKYVLAADKYRDLARLELRSNDYLNIVWQAIECYRKARRLDSANELLKDYLLFEERSKRPRALLALGQNYLNAGRWDDVLVPIQHCLFEYPEHPLAYEARLVMARALIEKQRLEEATEALMTNLYEGSLRPDSKLWRDSLFELGNAIYRRGDQLFLEGELIGTSDWNARLEKLRASHEDFKAATNRLSEAVARFDRDKRSLEARYAIGRAYRSAAMFPKRMLDSGQVTIESQRRKLLVERRELLEASLAGYRDLRVALGEMQDAVSSPDASQALLRNCFFGEADVLFELGQYEESIAAYRNVGNRFMNEPEALEALVQIAECHRELGQTELVRRTLSQAEQLLNRIPPESDPRFPVVTRADRAKWQQLLVWLKK